MRRVFSVGQADRAFPGLPFWTKVRAADQLKAIAGTSDEQAPGTLGVVGTRLRYFQLEGFLFTYSAPRTRDPLDESDQDVKALLLPGAEAWLRKHMAGLHGPDPAAS